MPPVPGSESRQCCVEVVFREGSRVEFKLATQDDATSAATFINGVFAELANIRGAAVGRTIPMRDPHPREIRQSVLLDPPDVPTGVCVSLGTHMTRIPVLDYDQANLVLNVLRRIAADYLPYLPAKE